MSWSRVAAAAALVAALATGCTQASSAKERPPSQVLAAKAAVEEGAFLLDVRTPEEFEAGHIPGAFNVSVQTLEQRIAEVPRDKTVVVYCQSGRRSARALRILEEAGIDDVVDLGAMKNW